MTNPVPPSSSPVHRLLRIVGTLVLVIAATLPAQALQSGDFTYTVAATAATITGYTGAGGALTIPGTINSLPVISIGGSAFSLKTSLTSVTIPGSVTSIGEFAFQSCFNLTSVTIPSSVTSIGNYAFDDCGGLISVTIPGNVPSIGNYVFQSCFNLTSVTIPSSVTSIGNSTFNGCSKLTSLTLPVGVTSIGDRAFYGCTGLTSVTLPDGVTSIGDRAFYGCSSLTSVTIGTGVTSIGACAFQGCFNLTSVTIPASVTSIGSYAFSDCIGLTGITVDPLNSHFGSADGVLSNKNTTTLIQCPGGKAGSYTVPSSFTTIGSSAFSACTGLTSVTIPSSVTSIGDYAFNSCIRLTSMTLPVGVTSIGSGAFYGCSSLTSVTIGTGVTSIGSSAFQSCTGLITIYIKGNAPTLGTTVFSSNPQSNVYYLPGTTGWTSTYGGLFTVALGLPTITGQLSSVIANAGENVAFSVIAKTTTPLTLSYQWQKNGLVISSANAASLYLDNIQSANVGTYTVFITNDIGCVSSTATLTLTQGALYTQAQYDSALQNGLTAGIAVGRAQVTDSPNSYGLYSLAQVQGLNVGTPLLAKDQVSGKFKLTIGAKKSADLTTYTALPFSAGDATINAQGEMEFQFTSSDNAAFFRLESK